MAKHQIPWRGRLRNEARSSLRQMQDKGRHPRTSSASFEGFPDEPPEWESEQAYLAEELELCLLAGDIIRRSRQLLRLHHLKTHPGKAESSPFRKRAQQIPSFIDTHAWKDQILRKFQEEKIHLREGISLAALAREIDADPHHLSRFLNLHLRMSFRDLVNLYRVNQAKALLVYKPRESVLSVAFASGFSSKASFNRVFKQRTGTTPSEYRMKMGKG